MLFSSRCCIAICFFSSGLGAPRNYSTSQQAEVLNCCTKSEGAESCPFFILHSFSSILNFYFGPPLPGSSCHHGAGRRFSNSFSIFIVLIVSPWDSARGCGAVAGICTPLYPLSLPSSVADTTDLELRFKFKFKLGPPNRTRKSNTPPRDTSNPTRSRKYSTYSDS
jgi:hypothetical protein